MGFDRFLSPKFKHSARFPIVTVMRAVTVTMSAARSQDSQWQANVTPLEPNSPSGCSRIVPTQKVDRKTIFQDGMRRISGPLISAYMRDLVLCTSHAIFVVTSRQQILHHRNARNWLMSNVLAHCYQCGRCRLCWRRGPASLGYDGTEFQSYRNGVSVPSLCWPSYLGRLNPTRSQAASKIAWCWPKHPAYCVFINAEEIFRQKIDSQS